MILIDILILLSIPTLMLATAYITDLLVDGPRIFKKREKKPALIHKKYPSWKIKDRETGQVSYVYQDGTMETVSPALDYPPYVRMAIEDLNIPISELVSICEAQVEVDYEYRLGYYSRDIEDIKQRQSRFNL